MTFADAFRLAGPLRGDALDGDRTEAIRVIDGDVRRFARRLVADQDSAHDLATDVTLRLVAAQPGSRYPDFTDGQARAFVARTVRNALIDRIRADRARARTERAFVEERPPRPTGHGFVAEAARLIAWAEACVDNDIIPATRAAVRRARASFERDLALLLDLHAGHLAMDDAVAAERRLGEEASTARQRLHTRCSRVRTRLGVQALRYFTSQGVDAVHAGAIEVALAELGVDLARIASGVPGQPGKADGRLAAGENPAARPGDSDASVDDQENPPQEAVARRVGGAR